MKYVNSVFKITKHNNRFAIYTTENWTDSETIEKLVPKKNLKEQKHRNEFKLHVEKKQEI